MEIEIKYKLPAVTENDSALDTFIIYELNSFFNSEKYPPLQPIDIFTATAIEAAKKVFLNYILQKRLEIEAEVDKTLKDIQKEYYPQFTVEELKEILGGIQIKFVEENESTD